MNFIDQLIQQNFLLVRFLELTKTFRDQVLSGDLSHFGSFHVRREEILGEYIRIENTLSDLVKKVGSGSFSSEDMERIQREYNERSRLLNEIREIDQLVLGKMEEERDHLGDELRSNRKNRSTLDRFKSSEHTIGNELDQSL